jgi:hypothetical protein
MPGVVMTANPGGRGVPDEDLPMEPPSLLREPQPQLSFNSTVSDEEDEEGSEEQSQKQQQQHTVTFTGTIRPYAMSPFSCGTVRPSSQQSGKQRRIQNVLDQLDPKVRQSSHPKLHKNGRKRERNKERKKKSPAVSTNRVCFCYFV